MKSTCFVSEHSWNVDDDIRRLVALRVRCCSSQSLSIMDVFEFNDCGTCGGAGDDEEVEDEKDCRSTVTIGDDLLSRSPCRLFFISYVAVTRSDHSVAQLRVAVSQ